MFNENISKATSSLKITLTRSIDDIYNELASDKKLETMQPELYKGYIANVEKTAWYKLKLNMMREVRDQYKRGIINAGIMSDDNAELIIGEIMSKIKFPDIVITDISELIKAKESPKEISKNRLAISFSKKDKQASVLGALGIVLILFPVVNVVSTPVGVLLVAGSALIETEQLIKDGKLPFIETSVCMNTINELDLGVIKKRVFGERRDYVFKELNDWMKDVEALIYEGIKGYLK